MGDSWISASRSQPLTVTVVGPSTRFYSGISVYTNRLSHALSSTLDTRVILLRRLVPKFLFPGKTRVGKAKSDLRYDSIHTYDGIDWFWIPSILPAIRSILSSPTCLVLQWWSASTLHTYILLALVARLGGSTVVIEFHEVQDPGEEAIPLLSLYARIFVPLLIRLNQGAVVHTSHAYELLDARYDIRQLDVEIIPLGPFDHYNVSRDKTDESLHPAPFRILFFGLIRPYKGAEDLVEAFSGLSQSEVEGLELIVAGETWEGWTLPARLIENSPYRDQIRFINRYLSDTEVGTLFTTSDVLVLPYRRATSSGPLNIAMNCGLPVILYDVPELREAAHSYSGARFVAVNDVSALREAIRQIRYEPVVTHGGPANWQRTRSAYEALIGRLHASSPSKRARIRRPRHRPIVECSLKPNALEPRLHHSST